MPANAVGLQDLPKVCQLVTICYPTAMRLKPYTELHRRFRYFFILTCIALHIFYATSQPLGIALHIFYAASQPLGIALHIFYAASQPHQRVDNFRVLLQYIFYLLSCLFIVYYYIILCTFVNVERYSCIAALIFVKIQFIIVFMSYHYIIFAPNF